MEQTIFGGRRWSAANAYLKPALKRHNVNIVYGFAQRILIEDGRATGVEIERNGKIEVVKANREVIVSASSFNSPKLLMLSGIGPGQHLQDMGITVKADRPGVGANLQDHMEFYFQQVSTKPVSLYSWLPWFWQGVAKRTMAALARRARRLQPVRGLRLPALGAGAEAARHPIPFPAGGDQL